MMRSPNCSNFRPSPESRSRYPSISVCMMQVSHMVEFSVQVPESVICGPEGVFYVFLELLPASALLKRE